MTSANCKFCGTAVKLSLLLVHQLGYHGEKLELFRRQHFAEGIGSYAVVIALLQDLPLDEVGRQYGEEMVISHFSREEQLVSPTPSASTSAADVRVVQKRKNPPVEADKLVVSDIPLPPEKKAKLTVGGIQLGEKLPPPIPRLEYGRIKELLACLTIKVTKALVQHQLPFVGLNGQRLHDPSQPRFKDRKPQGRRATMEGTTADQSEWRYDPSFRDSYRRSHEDSLRRGGHIDSLIGQYQADRDEFNEATANLIHLYNFTSFVGDTVNKADFPTQGVVSRPRDPPANLASLYVHIANLFVRRVENFKLAKVRKAEEKKPKKTPPVPQPTTSELHAAAALRHRNKREMDWPACSDCDVVFSRVPTGTSFNQIRSLAQHFGGPVESIRQLDGAEATKLVFVRFTEIEGATTFLNAFGGGPVLDAFMRDVSLQKVKMLPGGQYEELKRQRGPGKAVWTEVKSVSLPQRPGLLPMPFCFW